MGRKGQFAKLTSNSTTNESSASQIQTCSCQLSRGYLHLLSLVDLQLLHLWLRLLLLPPVLTLLHLPLLLRVLNLPEYIFQIKIKICFF